MGVGVGANICLQQSDRVPHLLFLSPALFDSSLYLIIISIQQLHNSHRNTNFQDQHSKQRERERERDWTGKVSTFSSFRVYGSCKIKGFILVSCVLCKFFSVTSTVILGKKLVTFLISFPFLFIFCL